MKRTFLHAFATLAVAVALFTTGENVARAEDAAPLWSLQPVANPPVPAVQRKDWAQGRVDHFILAELEKNGLAPSADADAPTMLRRLNFDLIGLPPSLAEIAEFEKMWARDPQAAIAGAADRLLASPDFGVRWGGTGWMSRATRSRAATRATWPTCSRGDIATGSSPR